MTILSFCSSKNNFYILFLSHGVSHLATRVHYLQGKNRKNRF